MVQEEISYEQSLETMNEAGLRAECIRLKKELDIIKVQQLTMKNPDYYGLAYRVKPGSCGHK